MADPLPDPEPMGDGMYLETAMWRLIDRHGTAYGYISAAPSPDGMTGYRGTPVSGTYINRTRWTKGEAVADVLEAHREASAR